MATTQIGSETKQERPLVLNVQEVARLLGLSERSVWRLTSTGDIPRPIKLGRSRRWLRQSIDQFLAEKASQLAA